MFSVTYLKISFIYIFVKIQFILVAYLKSNFDLNYIFLQSAELTVTEFSATYKEILILVFLALDRLEI